VISPVSGSAAMAFSSAVWACPPPPRRRSLQPVALAIQLQNMDMVREAIEQRAGETLAAEDAGPILKWKIRRDDSRAAS
jgi:hypothetical protein